MDLDHAPYLGTAAPRDALRTIAKLSGFALRQLPKRRSTANAYLDVGCGNGFITEEVAGDFERVVGVDVEPERLDAFRRRVAGQSRFDVRRVGAGSLEVEANAFSLVTAFEVLEHVEDVDVTIGEIVRALAPGGVAAISTPQILFPIEMHGIRLAGHDIERKVPLLPYVPPLHRRISLARVFGSRELDAAFRRHGLRHLETAYAAPQLERAASDAARWESRLAGLRPLLRPILDRLETWPGVRRLVGVSVLKAYRKE